MANEAEYFFCGLAGSGMFPLAMLLKDWGRRVEGSDRAFDQDRAPERRAFLEARGVRIFPQDGSGVTRPAQVLVTSAAVEASIPDVAAAQRLGLAHLTRAQLLSQTFNSADRSIGVAGTSGKSTITGMIGWILRDQGMDPTIVNGATMANFVGPENPYASWASGRQDFIVAEIDESDGSIELYNPTLALLSTISHDHKPLEEVVPLFERYLARAQAIIANADDARIAALADRAGKPVVRYGARAPQADVRLLEATATPEGVEVAISAHWGSPLRAILPLIGGHNVSNALGAIAAATQLGVAPEAALQSLTRFKGIARRLELVGRAGGVTIIDDFAHNPEKIAASMAAVRERYPRALYYFQPHGFGPLAQLHHELRDAFAEGLRAEDALWINDPVYFGGTVTRNDVAAEIARALAADGRAAFHAPDRASVRDAVAARAREGDAIVVMGARDDSLSEFARSILAALPSRAL